MRGSTANTVKNTNYIRSLKPPWHKDISKSSPLSHDMRFFLKYWFFLQSLIRRWPARELPKKKSDFFKSSPLSNNTLIFPIPCNYEKSWTGYHVARRGRKIQDSNKMSVSFESDELFKKSLSYVGSSRAGPAPSQGMQTISIFQKNTRIFREWRAFQKILMIFNRSDGF